MMASIQTLTVPLAAKQGRSNADLLFCLRVYSYQRNTRQAALFSLPRYSGGLLRRRARMYSGAETR